MAKKIVLLAVHGMGNTKENFADEFQDDLAKRLGESTWNQVLFDKVYYQGVLQNNQQRVMKAMKRRDIDWIKLREFMLYGFSDAAGLERMSAEKDSPYHKTQKIIRDTLGRAFDFIGQEVPVVIICQSLGGQVISNYLWDSQRTKPSGGTWKYDDDEQDTARKRFLKLKTLKYFYTTGCNIPIFVSGFDKKDIVAVNTSSGQYFFRWKNFYDPDDVLGWPLQPLSPSYKEAIYKDQPMNSGGSFFGMIGKSWNPFSHGGYWTDSDVLKSLSRDISGLI